MKKLLLSSLLAVLSASSFAETLKIDPSHTFPMFQVNHFGISNQRGIFTETSGTVDLDLTKKTGKIDVVIKTNSITTGFPALEKHLKSADFFEVEKYQEMIFKSDKLLFKNDKLVQVDGVLTIKGVSKPVSLNVTEFNIKKHPFTGKTVYGAEANTIIKRSDFGINFALPGLSDEVKITLNIEAN